MRLFELGGAPVADGEGGESYEDLCRSHIDAMIAAAAAREVEEGGEGPEWNRDYSNVSLTRLSQVCEGITLLK